MKKYCFKGTNQEIKLGDKLTQIITCSNGKKFQSDSIVDMGVIDDLLKRESIEIKDVTPVKKDNKQSNHTKLRRCKKNKIKVIKVDNIEDLFELLGTI